ncbi:S8 family peptidase [Epilithonimonas sp.]|uniref:S8 family peptidase n=1 Tax=Epilithonimonas sp. TaxID=2894511 RepID=UPI0028AAADD4|nr:S8 family peptidase [Epilithonimonas sp.]
MTKVLFSVSFLFSLYYINGQDRKLKNEFALQRVENEKKLDQFLPQTAKHYSDKSAEDLKKNLAGFAGEIPLFYSIEETSANATSNVDELQAGTVSGVPAVTGNGIKITIFDAGRIQDTHEQFATNRAVNKEATTQSKHYHGTNVNSLLIGNGLATGNFTQSSVSYPKANAKGILPQATTDNYMFGATTINGTVQNNYEKLASLPDLNISNHSYGINSGWNKPGTANTYYWYGNYDLNHQDTYAGAYGVQDYNFDKIVYSQPQQIIVKSTGNYYGVGPNASSVKYRYSTTINDWVAFDANDEVPPANCSQGNNCIYFGSLAKNIITVGAVNQLTTPDLKYTQASDVVKGSFSSAGPRKDGAVKPDLTAVGVDMIMANYITSNPSATNLYVLNYGTSYAAPIVTGIAGALTQIQRNISGNSSFIFKADEMKALLTHTANEAGRPGPDVWYGWGLVDAKKAAQVLVNRLNEDAYLEKNNLQSGIKFTKEVKASGNEPLKVSVSWVDPAIAYFTNDTDLQQNNSSRLVNDLDVRLIDESSGTVYYPWRLDISNPNANATKGDNSVDNVEQIVIDNPTANGLYRIEVTNKNPLVNQDGNAATQDFALVATGTKKITMAAADITKDEVKVFPTKTKDIINVNLQDNPQRIALFDMNGKMIFESVNNAKSQILSLAQYPKGLYLVTIKTKSGIIAKKVIKE